MSFYSIFCAMFLIFIILRFKIIVFEKKLISRFKLKTQLKAREEVLKAQKLLEEKQRAEEDMLIKVVYCLILRNILV